MLELGLCPVEAWDQLAGAEGGRRVDFYFGEQFESPDAPRAYWAQHFSGHFARNASVGALPGLMGIFGSKRSYATFYWACRAAPPRWRRLCPAAWVLSFNVNGDEQLWKRDPRAFRRHALDRRHDTGTSARAATATCSTTRTTSRPSSRFSAPTTTRGSASTRPSCATPSTRSARRAGARRRRVASWS